MTRGDFLFLWSALLMVFLFIGEPDLWDNLHAWAMKSTSTTCERTTP